ncbi:hypothetical protein CSUI_003129, partial [Cystoisospora suis]
VGGVSVEVWGEAGWEGREAKTTSQEVVVAIDGEAVVGRSIEKVVKTDDYPKLTKAEQRTVRECGVTVPSSSPRLIADKVIGCYVSSWGWRAVLLETQEKYHPSGREESVGRKDAEGFRVSYLEVNRGKGRGGKSRFNPSLGYLRRWYNVSHRYAV